MQNQIIDKIEKAQIKKRPAIRVGDRVNVSVRLKEGDKERVQAFRGVVISRSPKSGRGPNATFTVRKISEGVGVERIFPLHSPFIEKIDIEVSNEVRRARLYYLRSLAGKKARLKESERFGEMILPEAPKEVEAPTVAPAAEAAPAAAAPAPAPVKAEAPKAEAKTEKPKAEKTDKAEKAPKK